jgi:hypothetical protein
VALLEGELVEAHWAQDVAEEKVYDLSSSSAEGPDDWWPLRQGIMNSLRSFPIYAFGAPSSALPSLVRYWWGPPLITKMQAATLRLIGVVRELIALQTAVSSTVERVLECSLGEASRVEIMGNLAAKF